MPTNYSPQSLRWNGRNRAIFLAILGLSAGLRLFDLGGASLWLDETMSLRRARLGQDADWREVVAEVGRRDAHPPLYYLALHSLVGDDQSARSPARIRLPSVLFGTGAVIAFYWVAITWFPTGWALAATFLFGTSGFQIAFAREARHYVLAILLTLIAQGAFQRLLMNPHRRRYWLAYTLGVTLSAYTFYYTLFLPVAHLLVIPFAHHRKLLLRGTISSLAATGLFFLPWFANVTIDRIRLAAESGVGWQFPFGGWTLPDTMGTYLFGPPPWGPNPTLFHVASLVLLGLLAVGAWNLSRNHSRPEAVSMLAWIGLPLALLAVFPIQGHTFEAKHLAFIAPGFLLLFIALCRQLPTWPSAILFTILVVANTSSTANLLAPSYEKEDWNGIARYLVEEMDSDHAITTAPDYLLTPLGYALRQTLQTPDGVGTLRSSLLRPDDLDRLARFGQIDVVITPSSPVAPPGITLERLLRGLAPTHRLGPILELPASRPNGTIHIIRWERNPQSHPEDNPARKELAPTRSGE